MQVDRNRFIRDLVSVSCAVDDKEIVEGSHLVRITDGKMETYNGRVLCIRKTQLSGVVACVSCKDLVDLIKKIRDDVIDVRVEGGELLVSAKRKDAGIALVESSIAVDVPDGDVDWAGLPDRFGEYLDRCAAICNDDDVNVLTTVVHITPAYIEASDNFRLLRYAVDLPCKECMIPAASLRLVGGLAFSKMRMRGTWVELMSGKTRIIIPVVGGNYHKGIDAVMQMESPVALRMPDGVLDALRRAEVFVDLKYNRNVMVELCDHKVIVQSRCDGGWYQERRKIDYAGKTIKFRVDPVLLRELIQQNTTFKIDRRKMRVDCDGMVFVVSICDDRDTNV